MNTPLKISPSSTLTLHLSWRLIFNVFTFRTSSLKISSQYQGYFLSPRVIKATDTGPLGLFGALSVNSD